MTYRLTYHPDVKRTDLPKIDSRIKRIIKRAIEERLATRPEVYGKPLQRTLKGYWKLRDGKRANDGLLHGFIKKSPKTPLNDLRTAKQRMAHFEKEKSNE